MHWNVVLPLLVLFVLLRVFRTPLLLWVAFWWGGLFVFFSFGFTTPIPQSAIRIYMGITTLALFAFAMSSRERSAAVFGPLRHFIVEPAMTPFLVVVALGLPALAALGVLRGGGERIEPPYFARTIHPSPPTEISVGGTDVDLVHDSSPFRELVETDPAAYERHVENGRNLYYQNCFFCHGDALAGDGMFAYGLDPIPTNFRDANVLPNFQESFFFWRVAKGGAGMPDEGGPWASFMPEWERFLTPDEIWEVILFLYDFTGYKPRAREEFH